MGERRNLIILLVILTVVAVAIAACGGSTTTSTSAGPSGETTTSDNSGQPTSTSAGAGGATTTSGGSVVDGAALFADNCAACHGQNGQGGAGPDLRNESDATRVADRIRSGGGGMPAFASSLDDQQITAVAQYVVSTIAGN